MIYNREDLASRFPHGVAVTIPLPRPPQHLASSLGRAAPSGNNEVVPIDSREFTTDGGETT
jgi:hypothetical protein